MAHKEDPKKHKSKNTKMHL